MLIHTVIHIFVIQGDSEDMNRINPTQEISENVNEFYKVFVR